MIATKIPLFLAVIAIGGCVTDPPDFSRGNDGDGGTGTDGLGGGQPDASADGGSSTGPSGPDSGGRPSGDAGSVTNDGGLLIGCHTAEDCPGTDVCCGRKEDNDTGAYKSVACEATCDGTYTYDHSTFCEPNDPHSCDGVVVNPHCEPSDILPNMFVCVSG